MPIFLEFPLSVVQRTHLPCFEPAGDAVEVKSMVTDSPRNGALFRSSRRLVGLTLYACGNKSNEITGPRRNHLVIYSCPLCTIAQQHDWGGGGGDGGNMNKISSG